MPIENIYISSKNYSDFFKSLRNQCEITVHTLIKVCKISKKSMFHLSKARLAHFTAIINRSTNSDLISLNPLISCGLSAEVVNSLKSILENSLEEQISKKLTEEEFKVEQLFIIFTFSLMCELILKSNKALQESKDNNAYVEVPNILKEFKKEVLKTKNLSKIKNFQIDFLEENLGKTFNFEEEKSNFPALEPPPNTKKKKNFTKPEIESSTKDFPDLPFFEKIEKPKITNKEIEKNISIKKSKKQENQKISKPEKKVVPKVDYTKIFNEKSWNKPIEKAEPVEIIQEKPKQKAPNPKAIPKKPKAFNEEFPTLEIDNPRKKSNTSNGQNVSNSQWEDPGFYYEKVQDSKEKKTKKGKKILVGNFY